MHPRSSPTLAATPLATVTSVIQDHQIVHDGVCRQSALDWARRHSRLSPYTTFYVAERCEAENVTRWLIVQEWRAGQRVGKTLKARGAAA